MSNTSLPLSLDIVVPVYNEQSTLETSIRRLHAYLSGHFDVAWRITIADNASTDATPATADRLAAALPGVVAVHLAEKGRGRALKHVWGSSPAEVLVYLDEDLSTDLAALPPLVAPLLSGHSDLAIGTRLGRSARVTRGGKREFISRSYNLLLRRTMAVGFTDAQCGFKAIRHDVADRLLPLVEDNAWFFDTELLILAERAGMRIHEIPVDWIDDPHSSVDIVGTAVEDIRGMVRVGSNIARGRIPLEAIYAELGRRPFEPAATAGLLRSGRALRCGRCCSPLLRMHCSTWSCRRHGCAGGELRRAAAHDTRQHLGEPPLHLRGAGEAGCGQAPVPGTDRLRHRLGDDERIAGAAERRRA